MSAITSDEQDALDMARLAKGEDSALDALMQRHGPRLFHYLVRQLQNETEAADLAQETFVRVYQHRSQFRVQQKFSTWLYTIATNLVRDQFRWRARHPQVSLEARDAGLNTSLQDHLPGTQPSPDQQLQHADRVKAVQDAIAELPEDLRLPLVLAEYEELSHLEIGKILKCSAKAVEMRVRRAREHLRAQLGKLLSTL